MRYIPSTDSIFYCYISFCFIFNSPMPFLENKIYFWYSLWFLTVRMVGMLLFASSIYDESKKPLTILHSIPKEGWFPETQRLCEQIYRCKVALSGRSFFYLTRRIVITIAGTILTYELVLLSFDGNKILSDMFNPCPKEYEKSFNHS